MWPMLAGAALSLGSSALRADMEADQAYDAAYESRAKHLGNKLRATMRIDAATKNISATRQDKILANARIDLDQMEAEANAAAMAAASGVEGKSVEAVEYQTSVNAAFAKNAKERELKSEEASYIAQIYGAAYDASQPFNLSKPPDRRLSTVLGMGQAAINNWSLG